jgi:hypothetical protein
MVVGKVRKIFLSMRKKAESVPNAELKRQLPESFEQGCRKYHVELFVWAWVSSRRWLS